MDGARSLFLVVFLCLAVPAAVQSPASAHTARSSELLLLADGQLIEFPFSKRADGYEVRFPGGPQFIESSRVLCVAESRADAWKHLRSTFPSLTPEIHLSLAKWCIRYQLEDCAERELLDALNLDPNRTEAMRLLEKVTGRRLADSSGKAGQRGSRAIPGAPGMAAPASAQSLGGLSTENARSFVRRVQPLLSNRCAATGCHGPGSASEFHFSSIRNGSTPLTAERNLAAVLEQVEPVDPLRSPLLLKADQLHGEMQEPAFRGRVGAQQRQMLREWVEAAVADLHPELVVADAPGDYSAALPIEDTPTGPESPETSEKAHGRPVERAAADQRFIRQAVRAVASDPFSPASFNSRFHQKSETSPP